MMTVQPTPSCWNWFTTATHTDYNRNNVIIGATKVIACAGVIATACFTEGKALSGAMIGASAMIAIQTVADFFFVATPLRSAIGIAIPTTVYSLIYQYSRSDPNDLMPSVSLGLGAFASYLGRANCGPEACRQEPV